MSSATKNDARKFKASRSKSVSHSMRAGLQFPVDRVAQVFKDGKYSSRVKAEAPVYLTAVLEYLAAEVLELAGDKAREEGTSEIMSEHIKMAFDNDDELSKLFGGVTIAKGGVNQ